MNMPYQQPMMNYTPNYGAYQYNPMASYQRYQQPEPTQGISGRVVQAVETINPNEVPMDGSMAFFPKQDMSEIYVKGCLLYTSPSPRDAHESRMPSSA